MKALKHILFLMACLFFSVSGHAVQIRREPGYTIPESVLPTDRDNPALWMPASAKYTRAAAPGAYAVKDIPRTGSIEYLLILVDFSNLKFTIKDTDELVEQFSRMYNEHGYSDTATYTHRGYTFQGATGSVNDYFRAQSYGQYNPTFRIVGPIHMPKGYETYGKNIGSYDDKAVMTLVTEICDSLAAREEIGLAGYARNGNIDQLSIIYAGRGENYRGADKNTIWPQSSILHYNKYGINDVKYACTCELFWDSDSIIDGIGTFCHEFSHTLGLQDFYNTSASATENNLAMGYWSIMDYGNYENQGFSPVGYTAFEKYSLGWMNIEEISHEGQYVLNDISTPPDPDNDIHSAYRLNAGNDNQFIILENHIKTGWYKYHASEGLMVTAVNYDNNSWAGNTINTSSKLMRYCILPADNNNKSYTNAGDLFPYKDIDSITTTGTPPLCVQTSDGPVYPLYSIYNISRVDSLLKFTALFDKTTGVEMPVAEEVSITAVEGGVSVSAPVGSIVSVHDISGKMVLEAVTSEAVQYIGLPGSGLWIVRCGHTVRKLRIEK